MTDYHRAIKEFLVKALESLLVLRCEPPAEVISSSQQGNSCLQVVVGEYFGIRTAFPLLWNHDLRSDLTVSLELLMESAGCSALVERWHFLFSPLDTYSTPDTPFTFLKKSSISLRALLLTALVTPSKSQYRGKLAYKLHFETEKFTKWPENAGEVVSFPLQMLKVQSPIGTLTAKVEYLRELPVLMEGTGPVYANLPVFSPFQSESESKISSSELTSSSLDTKTLGKLAPPPAPNSNSQVWIRWKALDLSGDSEESSEDEVWTDREGSNPFGSDEKEEHLVSFYLKCREVSHKRVFEAAEAELEQGVTSLKERLAAVKGVYGGFATRQLETKYNSLLEALVCLLSYRVLAGMKGEQVNDGLWTRDFVKVYRRLSRMETAKYLPPKFTLQCQRLSEHLLSTPRPSLPSHPPSSPMFLRLPESNDFRVLHSARRAEPSPPPDSSRSPSPVLDLLSFYARPRPKTSRDTALHRGHSAHIRRQPQKAFRLKEIR